MESYTTEQTVFVTKTFYPTGGSYVAGKRHYLPEFAARVAPSEDTTYWFIKHFEKTKKCV
jgi:hypothetical protein